MKLQLEGRSLASEISVFTKRGGMTSFWSTPRDKGATRSLNKAINVAAWRENKKKYKV
jgi:hypothetical protein